MAEYTVQFSKHATLSPRVVDRVRLTPTGFQVVMLMVSNRGSADLFFDYTYPDGRPPMANIAPGANDTITVLPGETLMWTPSYEVTEFTVVSASGVPYSIQQLS